MVAPATQSHYWVGHYTFPRTVSLPGIEWPFASGTSTRKITKKKEAKNKFNSDADSNLVVKTRWDVNKEHRFKDFSNKRSGKIFQNGGCSQRHLCITNLKLSQ